MHPASLPFLYKLRRSQWWSAAELEELQWRRLSKLLRHAYAHTSYYRRLFESVGLLPDDVRSIDDLKRLPVTTKDDLQRESVENLIATSHERQVSIERRTSGTTGQPLQFLLTRRQKEAQDMVQARALIENGMLLMDRRAVFVAPWYRYILGTLWRSVERILCSGTRIDFLLAVFYMNVRRRG